MDSRATRENDDSSLSVILEGARRAQLGDPLFTAYAVTLPLTPSRQGRGNFFRFPLFKNYGFAVCGFATGFPRYAQE